MTPVQLQQLESLTEKAYTAPSSAEGARAEEALKVFATPEYLPQCRFVLDNSHSDYATLFAASSMMKILTNAWNSFSVADRIEVHILTTIYIYVYLLIKNTKLLVECIGKSWANNITVSLCIFHTFSRKSFESTNIFEHNVDPNFSSCY
jgi:hypothetical protein